MMCVQVVNGYLSPINPPPSSISECTYVLLTPGEVWPFVLSTEQALQIAVAIGGLWAFAFVLRSFVRQIIYQR